MPDRRARDTDARESANEGRERVCPWCDSDQPIANIRAGGGRCNHLFHEEPQNAYECVKRYLNRSWSLKTPAHDNYTANFFLHLRVHGYGVVWTGECQ